MAKTASMNVSKRHWSRASSSICDLVSFFVGSFGMREFAKILLFIIYLHRSRLCRFLKNR